MPSIAPVGIETFEGFLLGDFGAYLQLHLSVLKQIRQVSTTQVAKPSIAPVGIETIAPTFLRILLIRPSIAPVGIETKAKTLVERGEVGLQLHLSVLKQNYYRLSEPHESLQLHLSVLKLLRTEDHLKAQSLQLHLSVLKLVLLTA